MLRQLLLRESGELAAELQAKFNDPLQGSTRLHWSEYLDLFKAQAANKTVYLVIDALDSCQNNAREQTKQSMQGALKALPAGIRLLFTSRDDSVGQEVRADQKLIVTPSRQDVKAYVKKRIEDHRRLSIVLAKPEDQRDVTAEVTNMTLSSGMSVRRPECLTAYRSR